MNAISNYGSIGPGLGISTGLFGRDSVVQGRNWANSARPVKYPEQRTTESLPKSVNA